MASQVIKAEEKTQEKVEADALYQVVIAMGIQVIEEVVVMQQVGMGKTHQEGEVRVKGEVEMEPRGVVVVVKAAVAMVGLEKEPQEEERKVVVMV